MMSFLYKHRKPLLLSLIILGGILAITGVIYNSHPYADVAERYAPMSEAFARGDWRYAFHPRIQPLQTVCGGITAFFTGYDGFTALKIASLLWHFAGVALLFLMLRDVYRTNDLIPWGATAVYALFPYAFHMAYSGYRDGAKAFALILAAWGLVKIVRNVRQWQGHIMLGISCLLQTFIRADTIMVACACAFAGMVIECKEKRCPAYSFLPLLLTAAGIIGNSALNLFVQEGAMPDYRFSALFVKFFNRAPQLPDAVLTAAALVITTAAAAWFTSFVIKKLGVKIFLWMLLIVTIGCSVYSGINASAKDVWTFINQLIKGFYNVVGLLAIIAIAVMANQKKLRQEEFMLVTVVIFNTVLNLLPLQIFHKELFIASRYLYAALPLLFGFFVIGIEWIYHFIRRYLPEKYTDILLVLCCIGMMTGFLIHAFQPLVRSYTRDARQSIDEISRIIREDYKGEKFCDPQIRLSWYRSRQLPKILFLDNTQKTKLTISAYLAGGSMATWYQESDYMIADNPQRPKMAVKLLKKLNYPGEPEYYIWKVTSRSRKY